MKTDDLIAALSANLEPAPPPKPLSRLGLAAVLGLGAGAVCLAVTLGMRSDFGVAAMPVLMKALFSAAFAAVAFPIVLRFARPGRPMARRLAVGLIGLGAVSVIVGLISLIGEDPSERMRAWTGGGFPLCVILIPLLATPAAAAIMWLMRDLAPTRLGATGAAIGALAGGLGAMVYSMYCPVDSIAFVTTWYALGIAVTAALGAILGARLLRW